MKKIVIMIGLSILLFFMSACGNTNKETEHSSGKKSTETSSVEKKVVNGMKFTIDNQEMNEKVSDGKKFQLYTFTITAENMSSVVTGLGSVDFILKTKDGKIIEYDHSMAMFGNEIPIGESLTGKVSFVLEKGQVADKLVYRPMEDELAEWDVTS